MAIDRKRADLVRRAVAASRDRRARERDRKGAAGSDRTAADCDCTVACSRNARHRTRPAAASGRCNLDAARRVRNRYVRSSRQRVELERAAVTDEQLTDARRSSQIGDAVDVRSTAARSASSKQRPRLRRATRLLARRLVRNIAVTVERHDIKRLILASLPLAERLKRCRHGELSPRLDRLIQQLRDLFRQFSRRELDALLCDLKQLRVLLALLHQRRVLSACRQLKATQQILDRRRQLALKRLHLVASHDCQRIAQVGLDFLKRQRHLIAQLIAQLRQRTDNTRDLLALLNCQLDQVVDLLLRVHVLGARIQLTLADCVTLRLVGKLSNDGCVSHAASQELLAAFRRSRRREDKLLFLFGQLATISRN